MNSPRIELLVSPGCPHAEETERLLRDVAAALANDAEIVRTVVSDREEASRRGFPGSPTVRVDGTDLEDSPPTTVGLACRTYEGGQGVPPRWLIEAALLRALGPSHVLFLCVANSARSQLAEGLGRHLAPDGVRVSSAGSDPTSIRPQAVRALAEIGVDASGQRSKGLEAFVDAGVDCVITLCAEENCPLWLGDARRVHWALPDPAAATGAEHQVLGSFRAVRDEIHRRLRVLFGR